MWLSVLFMYFIRQLSAIRSRDTKNIGGKRAKLSKSPCAFVLLFFFGIIKVILDHSRKKKRKTAMSDKEKSNSMETHVQSDTCTFNVRPAVEKDVKEIFRLISEVHWNFSLEAVKADFHSSQTKPEGFFVAEVDGDVIGCSFGNILNEDICVIGYIIVTESWRKQGIGRTLLDKVCEFAGNRQICLFSAPHLVDMYKRRGFKGTNWGIGWPTWTADPGNLTSLQKYSIKNFDRGNWPLLLKYDSLISGMERSRWLDVWLNKKPNTVVKIAFDGAHIVGYAALQPWI